MRNRRHVADVGDAYPRVGDRAQRRFTAGAGPFYQDGHAAQPVFHRLTNRVFGCDLSGKRSALARTLEALRTGGAPSDDISGNVGDGDDGVVEGRVDVNHADGDVLANLLFLLNLLSGF